MSKNVTNDVSMNPPIAYVHDGVISLQLPESFIFSVCYVN